MRSMTAVPSLLLPRSTVRKIFIGKDGLRSAWSILIFVAIFAAISTASVLVLRHFYPTLQGSKAISELSLKFVYVNEFLLAFAALLSTWIMSKIERRGRSYGYGGTERLQKFLAGLGWGVMLISLLVVGLWKSGLLIIERQLIFGRDVLPKGFDQGVSSPFREEHGDDSQVHLGVHVHEMRHHVEFLAADVFLAGMMKVELREFVNLIADL